MREIRRLKFFFVVVGQLALLQGAWAGATTTVGGDSRMASTNQEPISVAVKFEGGPGQIPTSRAYITAGTNKFAFLVPDEYKLTASDPQKVTLMKRDGSCLIGVRVIGSLAGKAFDSAAARGLVYEEHPDATIATEFGMNAANASGPAFEIAWGAGSLERASRVGFVPLRAGVLEFSLDSSPKNLAPSLGDLNYVVVSFRASDENGKLEATPLSDSL
jgi:hypothetical protein